MPGVFPDYPAPVVLNVSTERDYDALGYAATTTAGVEPSVAQCEPRYRQGFSLGTVSTSPNRFNGLIAEVEYRAKVCRRQGEAPRVQGIP